MTTTPLRSTRAARTPRRPGSAAPSGPPEVFRGLAACLLLLAAGAAVTALLGPLGLDVIRYHVAVVMVATGAAGASGGLAAGFVVVAAISLALAVVSYRPVLGARPAVEAADRR